MKQKRIGEMTEGMKKKIDLSELYEINSVRPADKFGYKVCRKSRQG